MTTLKAALPNVDDLLALPPAELAALLVATRKSYMSDGIFTINHITHPLYEAGQPAYPLNTKQKVTLALAEAVAWLKQHGLVIADPFQLNSSPWLRYTRAADAVES